MTKNPILRVNVEIGPYSNFLFNEDLMLAYLFGSISYALKHEEKIKPESQRLAGLKSLLFIVEHSESYSKNKIFRPLIRANRRGELANFDKEMWVNEKSHTLLSLEQLK